jgi:hypothetical protein
MNTPELPKLAAIEDENKIITLLCYLLEYLGGLTETQLLEIVTTDELVSQFKLNDALAVVETRGLTTIHSKEGVYKLSESGKTWLAEFENTLAITLRRKVLQEGKDVLRLAELRKAVNWKVVEVKKNGTDSVWAFCACFLNESDKSPLMEIKLYSKTREGALSAEEKFLRDPAKALGDSIKNLM